jgi:hypothetical protein
MDLRYGVTYGPRESRETLTVWGDDDGCHFGVEKYGPPKEDHHDRGDLEVTITTTFSEEVLRWLLEVLPLVVK